MATDFLKVYQANGGTLIVRQLGTYEFFIEEGFFAFYFSFTEVYGWTVYHISTYQVGYTYYSQVLELSAQLTVKEVITKLVAIFFPVRGTVH